MADKDEGPEMVCAQLARNLTAKFSPLFLQIKTFNLSTNWHLTLLPGKFVPSSTVSHNQFLYAA